MSELQVYQAHHDKAYMGHADVSEQQYEEERQAALNAAIGEVHEMVETLGDDFLYEDAEQQEFMLAILYSKTQKILDGIRTYETIRDNGI